MTKSNSIKPYSADYLIVKEVHTALETTKTEQLPVVNVWVFCLRKLRKKIHAGWRSSF